MRRPAVRVLITRAAVALAVASSVVLIATPARANVPVSLGVTATGIYKVTVTTAATDSSLTFEVYRGDWASTYSGYLGSDRWDVTLQLDPQTHTYQLGQYALRSGATVTLLGSSGAAPQPQLTRVADTVGYVALGDSYSSGEGIGVYTLDTKGAAYNPDFCHRSTQAYSLVYAGIKGSTGSTALVACSGALTYDITSWELNYEPPQLAALSPDTALVTLTIGGNDVDFESVLEDCLGNGDCPPRHTKLTGTIRDMDSLLRSTYWAIHNQAPHAHITVLTYPQIFPADTTLCSLPETGFATAADLTWARSIWHYFDQVVAEAAGASGVPSIGVLDVEGAFTNHTACDDDGWVNHAIIGGGAEQFHPNAAGHAALGRALYGNTFGDTVSVPPYGVYDVPGGAPFRTWWQDNNNGAAGPLGNPVDEWSTTPDGGGQQQHFAHGGIYYSSSIAIQAIWGPIYDRYRALGETMSAIGVPVGGMRPVGSGQMVATTGTFCNKYGSAIYWDGVASDQAWAVQGCIYQTYVNDFNGPTGGFGFPTGPEQPIAGGYWQRFAGGGCGAGSAIYWSGVTAGREVHGCILQTYLNYGGPSSPLGFPTKNQYDITGGQRSDFQYGYITYTSAGGTVHLTGYPVGTYGPGSPCCFTLHGTWFGPDGHGLTGQERWTWSNGATEDSWAEWRPTLPADKWYKIQVYIPNGHAYAHAHYIVTTSDGTTKEVVVDQSPISNGWVDLGTYDDGAGGWIKVHLTDRGDASGATQIGADAMSFTQTTNPGGCPNCS